jgi:hypothetical protein
MSQQIITKQVLDEFGIDLADQDVTALLAHLNASLEERVGTEITESLSDGQLEQLLDVQEKGDDKEVAAWIQKNVPEVQQITQDHIDVLLGELAESADDVNKVS